MFKAIGDRTQPVAEWVAGWLKGKLNERLPIAFEQGYSQTKLEADREIANELYRELMLNKDWELLNCYADFLLNEKRPGGLALNALMVKSMTTLGYRRCTYDPSEDWKEFTERNLNKKVYEKMDFFKFDHDFPPMYVGENEKKLGKARSLYYKGKLAKKDKKKEKLLLKSATLGYVPAFSELAFLYEGMGQMEECVKWHEVGAKYLLQDSCLYLAKLNEGSEKEYSYLKACYRVSGTYPSTLMRLAEVIEREINKPEPLENKSLGSQNAVRWGMESVREQEEVLFDALQRVILEWSSIEEDSTEEVGKARTMLARLTLENKLRVDGVLAYVLLAISPPEDKKINNLLEEYIQKELSRLRAKITPKMERYLKQLKHVENEQGERERILREKRNEVLRAEREERERLEKERKAKQLEEFIRETNAEVARIREEKRLSWARPLDLGTSPEYPKLKGETEAKHAEAIALYQEALDANGEEDTVSALELAGEAGHPYAIVELAKYYHGVRDDYAKYWLEKSAKQGYANKILSGKAWKWNLNYCLEFMASKDEVISSCAEKALQKLKITVMTPDQIASMKSFADKGNEVAFKTYLNYIKYKDKTEWLNYVYKGALKGDDECIKDYVGAKGKISTASDAQYVELLKKLKNSKNEYVGHQWYYVYSDKALSEKFGVQYSLQTAFNTLKKLEYTRDQNLKKEIYLEIAHCYEKGIGTDVALYFASKYYRGYDNEKANYLEKKFNEKQEREIRERKAIKLMEQYPSTALNNLLKTNPTWANNIVTKYKSTAPEKLEEQLKARDEYLRFGFTLADMYLSDGTFNEYQVRGAYIRKKREQEERAKRDAEERARLQELEEQNTRIQKELDRLIKEQNAPKSALTPTSVPAPKTSQTAKNTNNSVSTATKKQQEQEAIAKVRARYGYVENNKFSEQEEYFFKICSNEETCGKAYKIMNDREALGKLYGVPPERVISAYDFAFLLKQKIEKVVGCCPEVEPKGIGYGIDYYKYAERDLAGVPCYGKALGLEVSFVQDIRYNNITTAPTSMDLFYDEYQKFHSEEISKFVDFGDYAREMGLNHAVYSLEREEVSNGKSAARKITRAIAKELLKHYVVTQYTAFGTRKGFKKYYYGTLFVPTGLDITFNFWGND